MESNIEHANHRLRATVRAELTEAGFADEDLTEDVITSYMPIRLVAEVENEERIQRMYMERASAIPAGPARDMLLSFVKLREVHIDNLRYLQKHRYK